MFIDNSTFYTLTGAQSKSVKEPELWANLFYAHFVYDSEIIQLCDLSDQLSRYTEEL